MKKFSFFLAIFMVLLIPGMLFRPKEHGSDTTSPTDETVTESAQKFFIKVKDKDKVNAMELEAYVLGVVLGEMPASFEPEALKAQSVATRTYTLRKILKQDKHNDADICTDSSCCQAYLTKDDFLATRGSEEDYNKIKAMVDATKMQVLTYGDTLIEATYFSCSGGMTEDAVAVWGTDVPYLESVVSPGENHAKYFESENSFAKDEFLRKLGFSTDVLTEDDISLVYTSGGGVKEMTVLGATYSGTQVRALLSLPSTAFSVTIDGESVIINSKGYGHRVGMSQYGADAMAVNGSTYDEILLHYYTGTTLAYLSDEEANALFDKEENL